MQLRTFGSVSLDTRSQNHRVGTFRFKDMGQGEPRTPGNFYLRLVRSEGDFFSPRHRHNFDQVRLQLEGTFAFGEDGVLKAGAVGYFPEGTAYGPQTSADETLQLVLQIGGPSGSGYVSETERTDGVTALSRVGMFRDGRYFASGSAGEFGADAFEAVWEHVNGQRICYPPPRFEKPLIAHPEAFGWLPCEGVPGVRHKRLWDLGQRTVGCALYRFERESALPLSGPLSVFVLEGKGRCGNAVAGGAVGAGAALGRWDALHLTPRESATLSGEAGCEMVVFTHPDFS